MLDRLTCYNYFNYKHAMLPDYAQKENIIDMKAANADIVNNIDSVHLACQDRLEMIKCLRDKARKSGTNYPEVWDLLSGHNPERVQSPEESMCLLRLPVITSAFPFARPVPTTSGKRDFRNVFLITDRKELTRAVEFCENSFLYRQCVGTVRDSVESPLTKVYIDTVISETSQNTTLVSFILWKAMDAQTEIARSAMPVAFLEIIRNEKDPCVHVVTLSDDMKLPIMLASEQVIPGADTSFTRQIGPAGQSGGALTRMSVEQEWHKDAAMLTFRLRNKNGKTQLACNIVTQNRTLLLEAQDGNQERQLLNLQNVDEIV